MPQSRDYSKSSDRKERLRRKYQRGNALETQVEVRCEAEGIALRDIEKIKVIDGSAISRAEVAEAKMQGSLFVTMMTQIKAFFLILVPFLTSTLDTIFNLVGGN